MNNPPPLVICKHHAPQKVNASVIWLHGLGADGYDFEPVVTQLLQAPQFENVRFILPHAPHMAVTRNHGYVMPAWYDVYGMTPVRQEDVAGIHNSQTYINRLITDEIALGIASDRIALAGFSQGGAVALQTALRFPQKLAGVLALSTYLPLHSSLASEAHTANAKTRIFMAHGTFDDVISLEMCQLSLELLKQHQYPLTWREYPMAHTLCAQELQDIQTFLSEILPQQ